MSSTAVFAASIRDTIFYNKRWKPCSRDTASYYRPAPKLVNKIYEVRDYYQSGQAQMIGHYSSLHPEKEEGSFIYYDTAGRISTVGQSRSGMRTGEWKFYFRGHLVQKTHYALNASYAQFTYYDSFTHKLKSMGPRLHERRHGEWKFYYPDGKLRAVDNYIDGWFSGCCSKYDSNGALSYEAEYYNGMHHGQSVSYDKYGGVSVLMNYVHDSLEGEILGFYPGSGALKFRGIIHDTMLNTVFYYSPYCETVKSTGTMKNFKKAGKWVTYYDCTDRVLTTEYYNQDTVEGDFAAYDKESGKPIVAGSIHGNLRSGAWKYYFSGTDSVRQIINYKNGKIHGDLISWFPSGKLRRKEIYDDGVRMTWNCYTGDGRDTIYYARVSEAVIDPYPQRYFDNQIVYPEQALRQKLPGKVIVDLSIDASGRILNSSVASTTDAIFNEEAIRVSSMLPIISPAIEDGIPVYSNMLVPVLFNP